MIEKDFRIDAENPVDFYGVNDKNIELIKKIFPKIKIVARGDIVKVIGEESE